MQAGKVYVQDRLREQGEHIWALLEQGAYFYVCGDASGMAPAVEEALLSILASKQVCPSAFKSQPHLMHSGDSVMCATLPACSNSADMHQQGQISQVVKI